MPGLRTVFHPTLLVIYTIGFTFSLLIAAPGFFNAEFLTERGVRTEYVGAVYILGSFVGLFLFGLLPKLLNTFGNYRLTIAIVTLMALNALLLAGTEGPFAPMAFLALFLGGQMLMYTLIDIFMESKIGNAEGITGRVRGIYLTTANFGFVVAPLIAGAVITRYSFEFLYTLVALIGFTLTIFISRTLKSFKDPLYEPHGLLSALKTLRREHHIQKIFALQFVLRLLYAIELIYMAVYFHDYLGLSLDVVGMVFAVSILPFAVIQFPLGFIGDTVLGERRLLVGGFLTAGVCLFALMWVPPQSAELLAIVLFVMNIGVAAIEVMSESYFFKHMKGRNDGEIVAFRTLTPFSYIVGPILGFAVLTLAPMYILFGCLGLIVFGAAYLATKLPHAPMIR